MEMTVDRYACLVHVSPAGTTRKVGRKIATVLEGQRYRTSELDLGKADRGEIRRFVDEELAHASLLVMGSPTYADHILYPVGSFLDDLPEANGKPALVYATFGGVSKGVSLVEMTAALHRKGYRVKGAAQVLCVHSMFFRSAHPLMQGHPDESDFKVLEEWMDELSDRLESGDPYALDARSVRPSSPLFRLLISTVVNMRLLGAIIPRYRFCSARCRQCGACQARCPTGRLEYLPAKRGNRRCLYCLECVRVCPSGAFDAPMWMIHPFVRTLQKLMSRWEEQRTKYYL